MELQTARGVRDFPPELKLVKNTVVAKLTDVFERFGFVPLETPILERMSTLAAKYAGGAEILKETFQLQDQGGRDLGLRYDLTVPMCRFVGMNPTIKMPFKRYEIGRVYRDGPIKLGRYREFWQCDVDIVGASSMLADAECIAVGVAGFKALGIDAECFVNSRKILNGMLASVGITEKQTEAILSLDKLKKIGQAGVLQELEEKGFSQDRGAALLKLASVSGSNEEKITRLRALVEDMEGVQGLKEVEELLRFLRGMNVDVVFDPSLSRGLSYYTGSVFEFFAKGSQVTSSVGGGGRYDNMIGDFLGGEKKFPAVGFSFGLEPICDVLITEKGWGKKACSTTCFVIPIKVVQESLPIVQALRGEGIATAMDVIGRGISKNLEYANGQGIPFVLIIGAKELQEEKFTLRDMSSGSEDKLSLPDIIKRLRVER